MKLRQIVNIYDISLIVGLDYILEKTGRSLTTPAEIASVSNSASDVEFLHAKTKHGVEYEGKDKNEASGKNCSCCGRKNAPLEYTGS